MKTYRTIDLLKKAYDGEIFKNKFRNVKTGKEIEQGKTTTINFFYVDTGENIFNIISNFVTIDINKILKQEWEEAQQPVGFTEAIKAYFNGKTIICKIGNETFEYRPISQPTFNQVSDNRGFGLFAVGILNGKWYIKEDEE